MKRQIIIKQAFIRCRFHILHKKSSTISHLNHQSNFFPFDLRTYVQCTWVHMHLLPILQNIMRD